MKKLNWLIVLVALVTLAACGSSSDGGGGGAAEEQAEAAFNDFGDALSACFSSLSAQTIDDGLEADADVSTIKDTFDCSCPSGGTVAADDVAETMVVNECVSATGETYTGTLSGDVTSVSGVMTKFGACTSASATNVKVDGTCGGTVSFVCPAGTVTCTVTDDTGGEEDECDLECS